MLSGVEKRNVEIVNELVGYSVSNFERFVAYLDYGVASYRFEYYVKIKGQWHRHDMLKDLDLDVILKHFEKAYNIIMQYETEPFKRKIMTVAYDNLTYEYRVSVDEHPNMQLGTKVYQMAWLKENLA